MATTYTPVFRMPVMTPADPAVKNAWGAILSNSMALIEQGAVGQLAVSINGLTTYTLTTANDASDQARYLSQKYTGALSGTCTVTMPNVNKVGWAQNSTTGGHNVILTTGAGTTATIVPNGSWYWYWCDGSGNVSLPSAGFGTNLSGDNGFFNALTIQNDIHVAIGNIIVAGNISAANFPLSPFWHVVTGSRALGVSYTNSTGSVIQVSVIVTSTGQGYPGLKAYIDGVVITDTPFLFASGPTPLIISVPIGSTYLIHAEVAFGPSLTSWAEFH